MNNSGPSDLIKTAHQLSPSELRREIEAAYARAAFLEAVERFVSESNGAAPARDKPGPVGPPTSKRQAVLRLLAEDPTRAIKQSDIRAELVERGWLSSESAAAHSLGVTLSKMFKKGEVMRPEHAHYRLTEIGKIAAS